jgi:DNA primase
VFTPDSIEKIKQTARIEEVVGDFVTLKRRGSNMIGRCPFHDEKTPSFTVNTARGIFKCFGCGKAGDSIKFVMEHEHFSYPEALKYIARRYNLEVEEREVTQEEKIAESERESLFTVNEFAKNFFKNTLHESEEGQAIGLSYFKERGFTPEIIEKFQLGYSPESFDALLKTAEEKGYKHEFLLKLGLIKENDKGRRYDAYRGRVIFPIHNISGRVIGFGGRVLKKTETAPKYINSPQSEIYDKSKTLYGIYFAKESIIKNDLCYLVEGYTDVTSMYQAGIKNAVASSGTSLTEDQIKLIRRFTENVTILYDGDSAGIKASFRGIDMILEQGLNVRVLLFPDGEDPDSFAKKTPQEELAAYLSNNTRDFITFKTDVLVKDAGSDPVKRAEIIRDVVTSISLIPDPIKRSVFIRECATMFSMEEAMLNAELNKILRAKWQKQNASTPNATAEDAPPAETENFLPPSNEYRLGELEEFDLIVLLIKSGRREATTTVKNENGDPEIFESRVADLIINELREEAFVFDNPVYNEILTIIEKVNLEADNDTPFEDVLIKNDDENIQKTTIDLITSKYSLSERWLEIDETIKLDHSNFYHVAIKTLNKLKLARVNNFIREKINALKDPELENVDAVLEEIGIWNDIHKQINEIEGIVINKR